jgi:peptidoglycan/LPS O-acetylase OafA/YrhL
MKKHTCTHSSRRLVYIDAARGCAALSVAVSHFNIGQGLSNATGLATFEMLSWPGNTIAVPLFFVISGFSVHYAERGKLSKWSDKPSLLFGYLHRRIWRIYPPYLAALILALLIGLLQGKNISSGDLVSHLTLTHHLYSSYFNSVNVVFWSIGVEVCLYALYPIALMLTEKLGFFTASATILVASTVSALIFAIHATPSLVGLWFFPNLFFGWWMGSILAENHLQNIFSIRHPKWWTIGALIFLLYLVISKAATFYQFLWPFSIPILVILCAWPLSFLLILEQLDADRSHKNRDLTRVLAWLGGISYSLYLVHQPLIDVRHIAIKLLPAGFLRTVLFIIWYFVPILVAWIFWKLVEIPSMRMARRKMKQQ